MATSDKTTPQSTASVWQERYGSGTVWSGNPNAALVHYAQHLTPGRALELGCGEGADAIWLAHRGWQVTAVDVSAHALARGAEQASSQGVEVAWVEADLAHWRTEEQFDLVASFFLHSPVNFPRAEILKAAARAVAPGGILLVVGHADFGKHKHSVHHPPRFPSPREVIEEAELQGWEILAEEFFSRDVREDNGNLTPIKDAVLMARRPAAEEK